MKKNTQVTRFGTVALAVLAGALVLATAAPAFATEPLVVQGMVLQLDGLEVTEIDQPAITDGGDWEMVESDEPITDGGADEMVEPDEPITDGGADEMVEPDEPEDLPGDGTEGDAPAAEVETTTPEPSDEATVPAQPDEPSLPFTGGNSTPFVLIGLVMALAGVGVLIARRQVFNR